MSLSCRLCGLVRPSQEFIITLKSESLDVALVDLVEYFCRVKLDRDPKLPQDVCKTCKVSLENFMFFCDSIEKYQKILVKKEKTIPKPVVVEKPITKEDSEFVITNADILNNLFENDEDLDSPASDDESASVASSSASISTKLRKKPQPQVKPVCVVLERLDIVYQKSDTESDEESEEDEEIVKSETKRRRSTSVDISPKSKRMRISPIKIKKEKLPKPDVTQTSQTYWKDFKSYHKFFESELSLDYNDSNFNLPVPESAKAPDGSLFDDYADKFAPWSAIELKCSHKSCYKKFLSPYELRLHNENYHPNQSNNYIRCSMCPSGDFTFTEFFKHVIDKHYRHLRYCCVMCSKMFFNFTALFHHYGNSHSGFTDIKMCLYDGLLFESYESLEKHVTVHAAKPKAPRIKFEKESPAPIINNNVYDCDTCGNSFNTPFHLETHKKTVHSRKYGCGSCDLEFSSSYSLIVHESKAHC